MSAEFRGIGRLVSCAVFVFRFLLTMPGKRCVFVKKIPIGTNAFLQNDRMGGGACDERARFAAFLAGIRFGTNVERMIGQETYQEMGNGRPIQK
ncbi:MAG: hypothetical protein CVU39_13910 [Chloroflexi bacterium HGW-Chloroflexi-10]|nr:MAG: hypothetical protein CVU39_13910 [Chloroflexi bacterium HGW-Chloroflexi-10]